MFDAALMTERNAKKERIYEQAKAEPFLDREGMEETIYQEKMDQRKQNDIFSTFVRVFEAIEA